MTTNLSGSLEAFPLDDVLALLGMGRRTARLEISSPSGIGAIHLVDGQVSTATADLSRASLLRQVVAAGAVPVSDLAAALDTPEPVRFLVERGCLDAELVAQIALEHVVDAVGELLRWTHGEFAVWVGQTDPGDVGVRIGVDDLVEQGRARVAEWERVRAALPDDDVVLLVVPALDAPAGIEVDEWSVLARIDGRRTLAEVVSAAGGAPLVACDRIAALIGRGLVEVREPGWAPELDQTDALLETFERADDVDQAPAATVALVVSDVPGVPEPAPSLESHSGEISEDRTHAELEPEGVPVVDLVAPGFIGSWLTTETDPEPADEPADAAFLVAEPTPAFADQETIPVIAPGSASEDAQPVDPVPIDPAAAFVPIDPAGEHVAIESASFALPAAPAPAPTPMAPAVEWSPWAQALGLAAPAPAGELIVDPLAGRGIAQLIADAAGLADIEHVPVPVVPLATDETWDDDLDDEETDGMPARQIVHELDLPVPGPRPAAEAAPAEPSVSRVAGSRPDEEVGGLRAGGLLSDLISGVRGL